MIEFQFNTSQNQEVTDCRRGRKPESMETWHSVVPLLFTFCSSVLTWTRGKKQLVNAPATRCAAALNEPLLLTWEDRAL